MIQISRKFTFDSAHYLPTFPEGHKCRRLHGHTFHLEVVLEGECEGEKGYLMDFGRIKSVVQPYVDCLDHSCINDVGEQTHDPLLKNPTAENLARWFWKNLKPKIPYLKEVLLKESENNCCRYTGEV